MSREDSSDFNRRSLLKTVGATGVVGTSSMLAGCTEGGNGGGGTAGGNGGNGGGGQQSTDTESPTAQTKNVQTGGQLKVALQSDPWTLHPHMYQDTSSSQLAQAYGNQLLTTDNQGNLQPDLAKEVPKPQNEGKKYVFKLREGVKFHGDYGELKAEDVVSNVRTILKKEYGSPARADYEEILVGEGIDPKNSVQATGEYEVTFNLAKPYAPFLYKVTDGRMTIVPPKAIEEYGEDLGTPDVGTWGTGPFQFKEGQPDDHYTFEKYDDYFKKDDNGTQLPYLDSVRYNVVPESSVRATQIKTGGIDISEMVPAQDVQGLKNAGKVQINSRPGSSLLSLYVNTRTYDPFTKKKMRQALAYGINKEAIIQTKFKGLAEAGWTIFPSWHWAYDKSLKGNYKHDPQKAKSLAQEAGHSSLTFNCSPTNQPLFTDVATIMQQSLNQIGLKMEVTPKEKSAAWEPTIGAWDPKAFKPKDKVGPPSTYESHIEDLTYSFDADGMSYITFHTDAWLNVSYYSNKQVDKWLEQARASTKREERKQLYSKAQKQIMEDTPQIHGVWWNVNQAYRQSVQNFRTYPDFTLDLEQVWKKQ